MFVKVVLISERDNTFCRQLEINEAQSSSNHGEEIITKCISDMIAHLGFTGLTETGNLRQIKLNEIQRTEAKKSMTPVVTNICGKIIHPAQVNVYTPEVRPYIKEVRNCFGTKYRVYSTAESMVFACYCMRAAFDARQTKANRGARFYFIFFFIFTCFEKKIIAFTKLRADP